MAPGQRQALRLRVEGEVEFFGLVLRGAEPSAGNAQLRRVQHDRARRLGEDDVDGDASRKGRSLEVRLQFDGVGRRDAGGQSRVRIGHEPIVSPQWTESQRPTARRPRVGSLPLRVQFWSSARRQDRNRGSGAGSHLRQQPGGGRSRPSSRLRRNLWISRSQRRWQEHHGADAVHPLKPTAGRASVAGYDIVAHPGAVRIRIGVALQEAALDERQTGREILDLQARLYGLSAADRAASIARAVDLADIGDAMDARVKTYSGGMRRRLDLAASLIHGPEVLFLDEAHHRPRSGQPGAGVGRGAPVERRAGGDGVSHHAVSRGGRCPGGPGGHHRRRPHRRAGLSLGAEAGCGRRRDRRRPSPDAIVPAAAVAETVPEVDAVTQGRRGITIATADGAATVGIVAVALSSAGLHPQSFTVRTPSLDDVFLLATGHRMPAADSAGQAVGAAAGSDRRQAHASAPATPHRSGRR